MDVVSYILSRNYTDRVVRDLINLEYLVVDELPEYGEPGIIYLLHLSDDVYEEYIWQKDHYVKLGEPIISSIIIQGYYFAGVFWKEATHANRLPDKVQAIYIDLHTRQLYFYDTKIHGYKAFLTIADGSNPGLVKLYQSIGENTDGAMSQKATTDMLAKKVELDTKDLDTDECLGLKIGN